MVAFAAALSLATAAYPHDGVVHGAASAPAPAPAEVPAEAAGQAAAPAGTPLAGREIAHPAAPGARGPRFAQLAGGLALSWLEPLAEGGGWRFAFAVRAADGKWSAVREIARGTDLVAGGADAPALAEASDGALVAVWVRRLPVGGEATAIEVARSTDGGATWQPLGRLHDDDTATEHAFAALVGEDQRVRAVWLDGRETVGGGASALRTATIAATGVTQGGVLDDRVCDCCATAAIAVTGRPLVLYRDRGRDEVRDIAVATPINADVWRRSTLVADGWRIEGCPVNGPAAAAVGEVVWVAWYTEGEGRKRAAPAAAAEPAGGATASGPRPDPAAASPGGSAASPGPAAVAADPASAASATVADFATAPGAGASRLPPRVRVARSLDGGHSFEAALDLASGAVVGRVDVLAGSDGGAVVSWVARDGNEPALRLRKITADGVPGDLRLGPGPVFGVPRLARQGDEVLAAWVESGSPERLRVFVVE